MKKSRRVQVREGNRPVTHTDSWMPRSTEQSAADVSSRRQNDICDTMIYNASGQLGKLIQKLVDKATWLSKTSWLVPRAWDHTEV